LLPVSLSFLIPRSVVLLAMFFKVAIRKGDRALIDLRLFQGQDLR